MMLNSLISAASHSKRKATSSSAFAGKLLFNGSNWLGNASSFSFGTTFTVECWLKTGGNTGGESSIFSFGTDTQGTMFRLNGVSGKLNVQTINGGGFQSFAPTTNFLFNNTWVHVAFTRDANGILRIFQNGTAIYTSASAVTNNMSGTGISISRTYYNLDSSYLQNGTYYTGLRVSNVCRYNANFTVPTASPWVPDANDLIVMNMPSSSTFLTAQGSLGLTFTNTGAVTYSAGYP